MNNLQKLIAACEDMETREDILARLHEIPYQPKFFAMQAKEPAGQLLRWLLTISPDFAYLSFTPIARPNTRVTVYMQFGAFTTDDTRRWNPELAQSTT